MLPAVRRTELIDTRLVSVRFVPNWHNFTVERPVTSRVVSRVRWIETMKNPSSGALVGQPLRMTSPVAKAMRGAPAR